MDFLAIARLASTPLLLLTSSGRRSATRYRVTTHRSNSPCGTTILFLLYCYWKKGRYGEIRKAARGVSQSACAGSLITVWPSRPEVYNIIMFLADNSSMTIGLNCTIPAIVQNYFLKTVLALQ